MKADGYIWGVVVVGGGGVGGGGGGVSQYLWECTVDSYLTLRIT
jgi:hypothetical protein